MEQFNGTVELAILICVIPLFRDFKVVDAFQGLRLLQVCLVHRMVYHFTENFKLLAAIIIRKQSQIIQIVENSLLQPEFENIFECYYLSATPFCMIDHCTSLYNLITRFYRITVTATTRPWEVWVRIWSMLLGTLR